MNNKLLNILYFILQEIIEENMDLYDDEEEIRKTLVSEGYPEEEIDMALGWLENYFSSIADKSTKVEPMNIKSPPRSLRVLSFDEKMLIDPEAYGFLINLESRGVIGTETKEEILHRSMNMFEEVIGVEEMKIATLLTFFEQGYHNLDELIRMVDGNDLKSIH